MTFFSISAMERPCSAVWFNDSGLFARTRKFTFCLVIGGMIASLAGCASMPFELPFLNKKPEVEEPAPISEPITDPRYSATPITKAPKKTVRFAQTALAKLGYRVGAVDGLWGPRSARAIRLFEVQQNILTSNGHLSELNLHYLSKVSGLDQKDFESKKNVAPKPKPDGITAKLKEKKPTKSKQLIIIEREYDVFAKPNPYSANVAKLAPGTGIYIVSRQSGWYEIESTNKLRGYVRID